jgi:uncharacterized protein (DUF1330 family)
MAAYIIADVDVKNPEGFEPYKQPTAASVARYGGRFLVQSSRHEVLEGTWNPSRLVVLEFPTVQAAKRWYESEEYRQPKALRMQTAVSSLILAEGFLPAANS